MTEALREARGERFSSDRIAFHFYDSSKISISFLGARSGPTSGWTRVDVHGAGFWQTGSIKCRFALSGERVIVPAFYRNSELVSCFSPPVTSTMAHANAAVGITFDEDIYLEKRNLSFTYYALENNASWR